MENEVWCAIIEEWINNIMINWLYILYSFVEAWTKYSLKCQINKIYPKKNMKSINFVIIFPLLSTCFHHSTIMFCQNGSIPWNFYLIQLHLSPCPSSEPIKTCVSFFWPMAASGHNQAYAQPCPKKQESFVVVIKNDEEW